MSRNWERLAGSTERFAVKLAFLTDPHEGAAIDQEVAASWGALELWVEGQNLCTHVDQGETLSSTHWYLLPLLEWLAESWDPLLHEERLPVRNSGDDAVASMFETRFAPPLAREDEALRWESEWYEWHQRHGLRAAADGGLLPNVYVRRFRDQVELSWDDEPVPGMPEDFAFTCTRGAARLDPVQVAGPLHEAALAAAEQLAVRLPSSTRLSALVRKLRELELPAHRELRVSWLAGLSPLRSPAESADGSRSSWRRIVDTIRSLGNKEAAEAALAVDDSPLVVVGSCQAALLFGAVAPTVTEPDVRRLAEVLVTQYDSNRTDTEAWSVAHPSHVKLGEPAWQQGYELAEELHDQLQQDDDWVDVEAFLAELRVDILRRELDDHRIRGISLHGPKHRPTIVVNDRSRFGTSSGSLRFTLAHELCHLLFDRELGRQLAVASGPWAPRDVERRANAFAAMFLMPIHLVRRAVADLPDPPESMEGVTAVATRLRVSRRAAVEHLYNLTLMDESERDSLVTSLESI
jgi:Zn-dependent peptidase ImmA (M78 family)